MIGYSEIAEYLRVHHSTAKRWKELEGMPVCLTPSGRAMISTTLIDQWLLARSQIQREMRREMRG